MNTKIIISLIAVSLMGCAHESRIPVQNAHQQEMQHFAQRDGFDKFGQSVADSSRVVVTKSMETSVEFITWWNSKEQVAKREEFYKKIEEQAKKKYNEIQEESSKR
jgi:hypothetical protein